MAPRVISFGPRSNLRFSIALSPTQCARAARDPPAAGASSMPAQPSGAGSSGAEASEWNVRSFVSGDSGSNICGKRLSRGAFYASSAMTGGAESYWRVEPFSLEVSCQDATVLSWHVHPVTDTARRRWDGHLEGPWAYVGSRTNKNASDYIRNRLLNWCFAHPGVAVIVGGPGARGRAPALTPHLAPWKGRVLYRAESHRCAEAAFLNGLAALRAAPAGYHDEVAAALEFIHETVGTSSLVSLGGLQESIRNIASLVSVKPELHRVPSKAFRIFREDPFRFLTHLVRGVWIVRLVQKGRVDHCVLVDCDDQLIYDGAEEFPVVLGEGTLALCGGEDAPSPSVAEVRRIELQGAVEGFKFK